MFRPIFSDGLDRRVLEPATDRPELTGAASSSMEGCTRLRWLSVLLVVVCLYAPALAARRKRRSRGAESITFGIRDIEPLEVGEDSVADAEEREMWFTAATSSQFGVVRARRARSASRAVRRARRSFKLPRALSATRCFPCCPSTCRRREPGASFDHRHCGTTPATHHSRIPLSTPRLPMDRQPVW